MSNLTAATAADRVHSIGWLRVKIFEGTAGLDRHDSSVMIVEVASPDRAWRLGHLGVVVAEHPWVHPGGRTCTRVRATLDADVRAELELDGPNPPVLADTPIASRVADHHEAPAQILEFDLGRRNGRRPR